MASIFAVNSGLYEMNDLLLGFLQMGICTNILLIPCSNKIVLLFSHSYQNIPTLSDLTREHFWH